MDRRYFSCRLDKLPFIQKCELRHHIDMSEDLRNALIEDYSLEKGPDDGEFYRKIREYQGYQGRENHYLERKWWARLHAMHENSARGLKRILANPLYRKAFDVQLEIPGLGSGMRLSTSQKMLAMRCDEVR